MTKKKAETAPQTAKATPPATPHRIVNATIQQERKRATPNLGTPRRR